MPREDVMKWVRQQFMPHIWCAGCGHGIIMHALLRALTSLGVDPDKTVLASGIGCSSRLPGYVNACTLHTAHGRALAFATGVKVAKPELKVISVMGDGDCAAIGGNHFIHACRRNIEICAIVMNNNIYGMTGGQASPTTPVGAFATTAPYGTFGMPFDIRHLAIGAGATFVGRATIAQPQLCETLIKKGIQHNGFSVIEIMTHCHTQYGRKNKLGRPIDNYNHFKEQSVTSAKADGMPKEDLVGKYVIGELFFEADVEEYTKKHDRVIDKVGGQPI